MSSIKSAYFPQPSPLVQGIRIYGWVQISFAVLLKLLSSCMACGGIYEDLPSERCKPKQSSHQLMLPCLCEPSSAMVLAEPSLSGGWPPVPLITFLPWFHTGTPRWASDSCPIQSNPLIKTGQVGPSYRKFLATREVLVAFKPGLESELKKPDAWHSEGG